MRELVIGDHVVNDDSPCFVIAELGHNHQGSVEQAKRLIDAAHECGVSAVKLQKRDNRSLFTRAYYDSIYNSENSFGSTYGEHREFLEFDRAQYLELKQYAEAKGLVFFATAFDIPSAEFLAEIGIGLIKIASGDLTNIPLLRHVARLGVPMIVSTGGGEMVDVERAYETIMSINPQLSLLQCTAGYPPSWDELNLRVIDTMRDRFPTTVVGFSSHDNGIAMSVAAYTLGARVVEKHFTLSRALKGTDHAFSLEPSGLRKLVRDLQRIHVAMGDGKKMRYASETQPIVKMSKMIVAARDLPAGHTLRPEDLAVKSPGGGLPPHRIDDLIGRVLSTAVTEDDALDESQLSQ